MHLCWRAWATTRHVEVGENLWESVLTFYHLGFWGQTLGLLVRAFIHFILLALL